MFAKILAMAVILASTSAFAADVNYEDPNLAYNSSDTSAENSACLTESMGAGKGSNSLQKCLVAQGMQDLEHVGASVSYTQRILDSDSNPTLGGSRRPAEATHFKLKKKRSRKH